MTTLTRNFIHQQNEKDREWVEREYEATASSLTRRGIDANQILEMLATFRVAIPSWAMGTGGTRFGKFPIGGEPRTIEEKFADASTLHKLTAACPTVSLHIPWDKPSDPQALLNHAASLGMGIDAMNSNTFEDQPGQRHSYKFGSLCHTDRAVRAQAIAHNKDVIDIGQALHSDALTIWIGDGGSFPGQMHFRGSLARTIDSIQQIAAYAPDGWRIFVEYKPFEPAFYSTVINDWGTAYLIACACGDKVSCLVDLGHHLPNTNIEQVVARLISVDKLGGFHFNDSRFADDDLTTGSLKPYQLFLIFHELVDAANDPEAHNPRPAYMIDASHNIKDPLEDLLQSIHNIQTAYTKALLVDRKALEAAQQANDAVMAEEILKTAYETDVSSLIRKVRLDRNAAIHPISTYRASHYREEMRRQRPAEKRTQGALA